MASNTLDSSQVDLLVIGGGINGAGIARDAAGRGLSVALCEQQDFAGATSSASTKLIHGGLRYLEHREFRLVGEALSEREVLLKIAPHISWPMRFVMPHVPGLRPGWMIRLGLMLYDRLGGAITLPKSRGVSLAGTPYGAGLKPEFTRGYVYSDGWVDDARLVVLNLRSAQAHGARILPRTRFIGAQRIDGLWHAELQDMAGGSSGSRSTLRARMLVNAAGPWVDAVAGMLGPRDTKAGVRLVKGSHIVVPRLYEESHAYILQDGGKRIFFMIPYERDFTLIGTTDVAVQDIAEGSAISQDELHYLCDSVSRYARRPVKPEQVVWSYSGVRPLYDDGSDDPSAITRDYTLLLDEEQGAPLLSVYGGKITTYRRLAEAALARLAPWTPGVRGSWTGDEPLPGGDLGAEGRPGLLRRLEARYPGLPRELLDALSRRHGALTFDILGDARSLADLGEDFGGGLFEREARHMIECEWAREPDDILWRRTKAGLHMRPEQRQHFAAAMGRLLTGA
jgi:glycerol-3-phosphate dehydrogenase